MAYDIKHHSTCKQSQTMNPMTPVPRSHDTSPANNNTTTPTPQHSNPRDPIRADPQASQQSNCSFKPQTATGRRRQEPRKQPAPLAGRVAARVRWMWKARGSHATRFSSCQGEANERMRDEGAGAGAGAACQILLPDVPPWCGGASGYLQLPAVCFTTAGTFSQLQSHHVKMPEELGKLELWFDVAVVVSLATKRAGLAWSHKSKS